MASYTSPAITDLGTLADLTLQLPGKTGGASDGAVLTINGATVSLGGAITFS